MGTNKQYMYMPQLDSLKLIAMILVFSTHCYFLKLTPEGNKLYNDFFVYSGIGVESFILLSGFFSAFTYKKQTYKEYITKKCYRLLPVHWICLLIGAYLLGIRCAKIPILTPVSIMLGQSLIPGCGDTNPPSWTLSTLFVLYILTPSLYKRYKNIDKKYLLPLAISLSIFSTFINSLFYNPEHKILFWFLYVSPYFRIVTYTIGMLLGLYINNSDIHQTRMKSSILEIISLLVLLSSIYIIKRAAGFWYTVPLVLLILSFAKPCTGIVSEMLSVKPMLYLSKLSFCFYLIHFPILQFVEYVLQKCDIRGTIILLAIVFASFCVSLLVAYILHRYIEIPATKLRIVKLEK